MPLLIGHTSQVFYSQSAYQINSIQTINTGDQYHSENYKQGFHFKKLTKFVLKNLNTDLAVNPLIKLFYKFVESHRRVNGLSPSKFGTMKLDFSKFNFSKNAVQPFGKYFEPELLKFFNICGSLMQTQCLWWDSGLLYGKLSHRTLDLKAECSLARLHNSCAWQPRLLVFPPNFTHMLWWESQN